MIDVMSYGVVIFNFYSLSNGKNLAPDIWTVKLMRSPMGLLGRKSRSLTIFKHLLSGYPKPGSLFCFHETGLLLRV